MNDITCATCQKINDAKFVKQAVPLHLILVKPKVWRRIIANYN